MGKNTEGGSLNIQAFHARPIKYFLSYQFRNKIIQL